jgi:hypothetical protein
MGALVAMPFAWYIKVLYDDLYGAENDTQFLVTEHLVFVWSSPGTSPRCYQMSVAQNFILQGQL